MKRAQATTAFIRLSPSSRVGLVRERSSLIFSHLMVRELCALGERHARHHIRAYDEHRSRWRAFSEVIVVALPLPVLGYNALVD